MLYATHCDFAIDLLMKNGYIVYMDIYGVNHIYWRAVNYSNNSTLFAIDILRLLALMIIKEEWDSKDSVFNYYDEWIK